MEAIRTLADLLTKACRLDPLTQPRQEQLCLVSISFEARKFQRREFHGEVKPTELSEAVRFAMTLADKRKQLQPTEARTRNAQRLPALRQLTRTRTSAVEPELLKLDGERDLLKLVQIPARRTAEIPCYSLPHEMQRILMERG